MTLRSPLTSLADDVERLAEAAEQGLGAFPLRCGMTAIRPMPMLKVRSISSCGTLPSCCR